MLVYRLFRPGGLFQSISQDFGKIHQCDLDMHERGDGAKDAQGRFLSEENLSVTGKVICTYIEQ